MFKATLQRTSKLTLSALGALALVSISPTAADAVPTVTCNSPAVAVYHVDGSSQLRRWAYTAPLTGTSGWNQAIINQTWGTINTFSGGSGVLFTINSLGQLQWYKDNNFNGSGGADWNINSGNVVGTGWSAFTTVLGNGDGTIYAVDSSGNLKWYRYTGTNGENSWASGSGATIGTGWGSFSRLFTSGSGVIYAVNSSGNLIWYRHLDPANGSASWANSGSGTTIGSGWNGFTKIGSVGAGIIFGRGPTGTINWYRHLEPLVGTASWANSGVGTSEGTGWNNNQLVGDVKGCVAS